jgi:hypothetical protein
MALLAGVLINDFLKQELLYKAPALSYKRELRMIIQYSWMLYKKILAFNKLLSFHYLLIIPVMGLIPYLFFVNYTHSSSENLLSYVLYFVFMAQTFLIIGKRVKNEFFFSSRCYTIFPHKRMSIIFYSLLLGTIDLNVVLQLVIVLGSIIYFTNWDFYINLVFLSIFLFSELVYLSFMMVIIEYIIEKFGTSKNLFLVTFMPFFFFEFYARMAGKFYLMDYYPISGWIGSTVIAAQKGDVSLVLFYFCISIIGILLGLLLLDRVYFPKKNNAF